jgi:hypothetical protein
MVPKNAEPNWSARLAAEAIPQSSQLVRPSGEGTHGDNCSAPAQQPVAWCVSLLSPGNHAMELSAKRRSRWQH